MRSPPSFLCHAVPLSQSTNIAPRSLREHAGQYTEGRSPAYGKIRHCAEIVSIAAMIPVGTDDHAPKPALGREVPSGELQPVKRIYGNLFPTGSANFPDAFRNLGFNFAPLRRQTGLIAAELFRLFLVKTCLKNHAGDGKQHSNCRSSRNSDPPSDHFPMLGSLIMLIFGSGVELYTFVYAGTDVTSQTFPPMTLPLSHRRIAAQNSRSRVNNYVVPYIRMTFDTPLPGCRPRPSQSFWLPASRPDRA